MQQFFSSFRQIISVERFESYRRSDTEEDIDILACYLWNLALCEALYPCLQGLEVALRNSINIAATEAFGNHHWFDCPSILKSREQAKVADVKARLRQKPGPINIGRVVAELNFGFWTSLLDARYEQILWPKLLKPAFPHMPNRLRTRKALSGRLNHIRY
ncbi:MAG: hypothetical protein ACOX87_04740, partial [Chloroflexota bacterium]